MLQDVSNGSSNGLNGSRELATKAYQGGGGLMKTDELPDFDDLMGGTQNNYSQSRLGMNKFLPVFGSSGFLWLLFIIAL